jgi:hypothetical protein
MTLQQITPVAVNSTLLRSVSYDITLSILELEFRDGALYRYLDVPETIYTGLIAADSKGYYFNRSVRPCFRYALIREPQ